jgi:hypothetical protein
VEEATGGEEGAGSANGSNASASSAVATDAGARKRLPFGPDALAQQSKRLKRTHVAEGEEPQERCVRACVCVCVRVWRCVCAHH